MKKLNLLHIYRGIASLCVMLFHVVHLFKDKLDYSVFFGVFKIGFVGVDFFFVLSGFIIFYIHHKDFGRRKSALVFYIKRFIRIFPVYWTIVVMVLAVYAFMGRDAVEHFGIRPSFVLKTLTLFPHWPMVVSPAWSLSFEVFFYMLLGAALYFLTLKTTIIAFFLYLVAIILQNYVFPGSGYLFILDFFIIEFLSGVFAAWIFLRYRNITLRKAKLLLIASVLSFITVWMVYFIFDLGNNGPQKMRPFTFGILFCLIIISSAWLEKKRAVKPLKLFTALADMSYVLYLVQGPVIVFFTYLVRDYLKMKADILLGSASVLVIILTLCLSWLTHIYLEKPLLALMRRSLSAFI